MFDFNRLTVKAQEGLRDGHIKAEALHHQEVMPEHYLVALLEQKDGVASALIEASGGRVTSVKKGVEDSLSKLPQVTGSTGEVRLGRDIINLLRDAEAQAKKLGDDYVSVEHIFLSASNSVKSLKEIL